MRGTARVTWVHPLLVLASTWSCGGGSTPVAIPLDVQHPPDGVSPVNEDARRTDSPLDRWSHDEGGGDKLRDDVESSEALPDAVLLDASVRCRSDEDCIAMLGPPPPCRSLSCHLVLQQCRLENLADDTSCEDGDPCTLDDRCQDGVCESGVMRDCDDADPCTDDFCSPETGCVHRFNEAPCEDGDPCTVQDRCHEGRCVSGVPADCEDGNPCTLDVCETGVGCLYKPVPGACEDGNVCTTNDGCEQGVCIGGPPLDCSDQDPCTADLCKPEAGCLHPPAPGPCDDGNACTTGDHCEAGVCVGGPPTDCDDHDPCTLDGCDPVRGCLHGEVPEVCNGEDDDCDGLTDEAGSAGCDAYFRDEDADGWGVLSDSQCLCGPSQPYTALQAGDCEDTDASLHPGSPEVCNGLDDDCDGETDEGALSDLCPLPPGLDPHGIVACEGGCKMVACEGASAPPPRAGTVAWYDLDGEYANGCECPADPFEPQGDSCATAIASPAVPDSGQRVSLTGNLAPFSDEDWWVVEAKDLTWNAEKDGCDRFNFKVVFTKNPGSAFRLEVRREGCQAAPLCEQGQIFEWATNFSTTEAGECKCSTVVTTGCSGPPDVQACVQVTKDPFRCQACPGTAGPGTHACSNNSARFYIGIRRAPDAAATCDAYEVEVSNGLYLFSGTSD